MGDLAEFLLARIGEDEAVAREAGDVAAAPWRWEHLPPPLDYGLVGVHPIQGGTTVIIPSRSGDMWPDRDTAAHIARHDPARVLAECDAKRRIVAWHRLIDGLDTEDNPVRGCCNCIASGAVAPYLIAGPCLTVRLLALPYADHPDFREEWRP